MTHDRAWARALAEHEMEVSTFLAVAATIPPERWHVSRAPGKWAPAEEALHVCIAYEFGARVPLGGRAVMAPRVTRVQAALARTLLLPVLLRWRTFPRGAAAPVETRPDESDARALTPDVLDARLRSAAARTALVLREAATRGERVAVEHAYFGALPPLTSLRLLSAHTRHHTAQLARRTAVDLPPRTGPTLGAARSGRNKP